MRESEQESEGIEQPGCGTWMNSNKKENRVDAFGAGGLKWRPSKRIGPGKRMGGSGHRLYMKSGGLSYPYDCGAGESGQRTSLHRIICAYGQTDPVLSR